MMGSCTSNNAERYDRFGAISSLFVVCFSPNSHLSYFIALHFVVLKRYGSELHWRLWYLVVSFTPLIDCRISKYECNF